MAYPLSVWMDDNTAKDLEELVRVEDRKRSDMIKVLIRRAARDLKIKIDSGSIPVRKEVSTNATATSAN